MSEKEKQLRLLVSAIVRVGQAGQVATFVIGAAGGWVVSRSWQGAVTAVLAGAVVIAAFRYVVASSSRFRALGFRPERGEKD